jgi:arylsulfatase A-like enzyme
MICRNDSACIVKLILILFTGGCFYSCDTVPDEEIVKPNVIFILADDLGAHDLSCTGSDYYETPNIDRISSEGITFKRGYSASRVCSPSRASIMTGQFTTSHGITDWIGAASGEEWRKQNRHDKLLPADYVHNLPHENTTIAEALKEEGYKTFFAGKWHLGSEGSYPEDHGFDINKGGWDLGYPKGGFFSPWDNPKLPNKFNGENLSMRLADETVKFIEDNKDTNFFAFLSFYAVHSPIQTTKEKWKKYQQKALKMELAENSFEMERVLPIRTSQNNPVYAGLLESMDDAVGNVLTALDRLGLEKNTIVIFTSDNGGVASGDAFSTSNLPLRGGKGYQWEGGLRVPYLIKVPWLDSKGEEIGYRVTGTDFYPTVLDLINVELRPDQHKDGVSLKPLMQGRSLPDRSLVWHYPHYGNQGGNPGSIIIKKDWKLIHYWEDDLSELYNLNEDHGEQTDVSKSYLDISEKWNKKLFEYLDSESVKLPSKDLAYDADKAALRRSRIISELLPGLEKRSKQMLTDEYSPGNNWWGSEAD